MRWIEAPAMPANGYSPQHWKPRQSSTLQLAEHIGAPNQRKLLN
jgi:hypothetical protein